MSLNRFKAAASSTTQNVISHLSTLTQADVPNYRVSGTAVASFTLLTMVSALDSCGSATTQLSMLLTLAHGGLFINQNYETSMQYATDGLAAVMNGAANTMNAVKENEWVKKKTESVSQTMNFYFGTGQAKPQTATFKPVRKLVINESDSEHSDSHEHDSGSQLNMKKTQ